MDPTLGEKQNDQAQEKQSEQGIISRGINSINNLRGANRLLSKPISRIGSRVVLQTGLRGLAAFLAGPGLPIAVAIISVFVFTLIIVGFGGAPPSETSIQAPPSVSPTQAPITPTPEP
jgi:CBS domain containing-hemolysin-like protein